MTFDHSPNGEFAPPERPPDPDARTVATFEWSSTADGPIDDTTFVRDGRLVMAGHGPSSIHGYTPFEEPGRDLVLDMVVRSARLAPDEGFGWFVRRNAADRYIGVRCTPGRRIMLSAFDRQERQLAVGPLADAMVLHPDRNRVSVAAVGPSITLSVNGLVTTSVLVDERFIDGYVGVLLEQRHDTAPELEIEWMQIRRVW